MAHGKEHEDGKKRHHRRAKRKAGGHLKRTSEQEYNAQGSHEMGEAKNEKPEFNKGGVAKKKKDHEKLKDGGHAEGMKAKKRADRARRRDGGRTPYSSGNKVSTPKESGRTNIGHEGERPPSEGSQGYS